MICPKCKVDIEYVFIYSTQISEGILNKHGKIEVIVNKITGQPDCYVCPECDEDITMSIINE